MPGLSSLPSEAMRTSRKTSWDARNATSVFGRPGAHGRVSTTICPSVSSPAVSMETGYLPHEVMTSGRTRYAMQSGSWTGADAVSPA